LTLPLLLPLLLFLFLHLLLSCHSEQREESQHGPSLSSRRKLSGQRAFLHLSAPLLLRAKGGTGSDHRLCPAIAKCAPTKYCFSPLPACTEDLDRGKMVKVLPELMLSGTQPIGFTGFSVSECLP
jgi:hypothetical protein